MAAWRAQKAAERMALLRLPPEEAQEQADLFQAGRRDVWDVKFDHGAYLNRLHDLLAPAGGRQPCGAGCVVKAFDPAELREMLGRLRELEGGGIVVGGYAVNLWALRYLANDAAPEARQERSGSEGSGLKVLPRGATKAGDHRPCRHAD